MKKYEYLVVTQGKGLPEEYLTTNLNNYGEQGWELVSVSDREPGTIMYTFKREIK